MNESDLAKLEQSVEELIQANRRLAEVCRTQQTLISKLVQERDTALDYIHAMEAMRK